MKRNTIKYPALLMLIFCIALCCFGCGSGEKEHSSAAETGGPESEIVSENTVSKNEMTEAKTIESVYRSGAEATLCIFTPGGSNGTGFLYKEKYVVTNAHVLYDADDFTLSDIAGREYKGAVVFTDVETDIAVILVDGYHGGSVKLGNSDSVSAGDVLVLIGNPADGTPFSFCSGKRVELKESFRDRIDPDGSYLPVDAGIVSGYSGGPVFDLRGELIGISNAAFIGDPLESGFGHLGLVIPINRVKEQIEAHCE